MPFNTKISTASRNAACNAVVDLIDGGATAGHIEIRSGTQPADPQAAVSGTLLATIPLNDPAFGNASAGVATAATSPTAMTDSSADASGTATWFRVFDSNNVAILDGSCGPDNTYDMTLSNVAIGAGQSVTVTSWTVTMPGA